MRFERLDFAERHYELTEWMDEPAAPGELRACLRDLERANRWTLGARPVHLWLNKLLQRGLLPRGVPLRLLDVGCGGGDTLRGLVRWARRRRVRLEATGLDLNAETVAMAREATPPALPITYVCADALQYLPAEPPHCIVSSLFTHHLPEAEIVRFVRWMENTAVTGWFINDLERAPVPYYLFAALARVAGWHRFVQHDGPVSIRRAFCNQDWYRMLDEAGLPPGAYTLEHVRPARLCVARVR